MRAIEDIQRVAHIVVAWLSDCQINSREIQERETSPTRIYVRMKVYIALEKQKQPCSSSPNNTRAGAPGRVAGTHVLSPSTRSTAAPLFFLARRRDKEKKRQQKHGRWQNKGAPRERGRESNKKIKPRTQAKRDQTQTLFGRFTQAVSLSRVQTIYSRPALELNELVGYVVFLYWAFS